MPEIDAALVRTLVARQFAQWADLPVRAVAEGGWDNRTFHLGDAMSVRLPSAERYVAQVEKEHRWLPTLASQLPLPIPAPLAIGRPDAGYPWPWSIYGWIEGDRASRGAISDLTAFAEDLADFLVALRRIDASDGPLAGAHNFHRGGSLAVYDGETRQALNDLADELDVSLLTKIWERALGSSWREKPVWVHGDIAEGNLLVRDGRLSAVIDFGSSGVGDPSSDLVIAWTLFDEPARNAFRARVGLDRQTWERARGWCLWKALITIAEHRHEDREKADTHRRWIDRIVADPLGGI
ncbi:aminoglycoside phosphotransferase (APT) family kinase protein [Neorhizobium sp. R1-B]|uniref:aminoglycoside phosphotransferase family protein n=1 Tax=Neorhizobium sp. R1-B TaxID=2485162 RepID=UPI001066BD6C|nr:aminoglycoside phosphotransferase family protein [Neorhizobium sp. R1-B]TDX82480.1 aminoglycoside phosphotransferase (APT) family kinase protein [Neorhizobium sp. R1-B]